MAVGADAIVLGVEPGDPLALGLVKHVTRPDHDGRGPGRTLSGSCRTTVPAR